MVVDLSALTSLPPPSCRLSGATLSPPVPLPFTWALLKILTVPQERPRSNRTAPRLPCPKGTRVSSSGMVSGRDPVICPRSRPSHPPGSAASLLSPGALRPLAELADLVEEDEDGGRPISALLVSSLTWAGTFTSSGLLRSPPASLHRRPCSRDPGLCEEAAADVNLLL